LTRAFSRKKKNRQPYRRECGKVSIQKTLFKSKTKNIFGCIYSSLAVG
jgi:hypothetical protein